MGLTSVHQYVLDHRAFFKTKSTRDIKFRIAALKRLKAAIISNETALFEALRKDLGRSDFESYACEVGFVLEEISLHIHNLEHWSRPVRVETPIYHFLAKSHIHSEPYGTVLIIGPWNVPFQLLIQPLIGAISAGNCAVLKPSEVASHTEKITVNIINTAFEKDYVSIHTGDKEMSTLLLQEKFDYIFFTGSTQVGRIIAMEAAKNLTPVTLELGGKSPCIVHKDASLAHAARRIAWGKLLNAGQMCIAPDYVLVHMSIHDKLLALIKENMVKSFGEDPSENDEYPSIITQEHTTRLVQMLSEGTIFHGGDHNVEQRYVQPTLITDCNPASRLLNEEIFGPILPIIGYETIEEALELINSKAKPLALYLFTNSRKLQKQVLNECASGGGTINDTIIQFANSSLPFGGVGSSGMGSAHGKYSFDTFSNKKAFMTKSNLLDIKIRYAPYKGKLAILRWLMR